MNDPLRIALAQSDFLVGDIDGNADKVISLIQQARAELRADAIVFPELTLSGYPPEDLLFRCSLYESVTGALDRIRSASTGIDVVLGYPVMDEEDRRFNAASLFRDARLVDTYYKQSLPNYAVFDEKRYFTPGDKPCVIDIGGLRIGLTICEDIWAPEPVAQAVAAGAEAILNLNASPYHLNKWKLRREQVASQARQHGVPVIYINLVGGQDELVFDGHSFVVDTGGELVQQLSAFEQQLGVCEFAGNRPVAVPVDSDPGEEESVYQALVLGVRDYVTKNGFPGVVLGLSGGIDSALTLAIAVDALGPDKVEAVMMPSTYTSDMSIEDAREQAETLGVQYSVIGIGSLVEGFGKALAERFEGLEPDVTEENIQARIRGNLLMAISNKSGRMLLTTGNKSEMAVGYATLYGDMAGGFAAIKDVPKTLVYRLARYRNRRSPAIPERVLTRAPSAELAPNQKDTDSLPDYDVLDGILERYVERDESVVQIIAAGFDADTVARVARMVDRNEYKRRQAAPGVRITPRAFGRDRRYPITSGFRNGK